VAAGFSKYCWHYNYNMQATAHYTWALLLVSLQIISAAAVLSVMTNMARVVANLPEWQDTMH